MKIAVAVSGGCVTAVVADEPCEVFLLDYDNLQNVSLEDLERGGPSERMTDLAGPSAVQVSIDEYERERRRAIEELTKGLRFDKLAESLAARGEDS
jgi:hypothetical protein